MSYHIGLRLLSTTELIKMNITPNSSSTKHSYSVPTFRIVFGVFYIFFIVLTITGNTLVVCAVLKYRRLRHKTNYIILSLAVADLTVAVLVMPFSVVYDVTQVWYFGWIFCYFWRSCDVTCCTASILHICCIALDRFWAIKDPLKYKKRMTKRKLTYMIVGTWALSVAISFVPIYLGWFIKNRSDLYVDNEKCDLEVNRIYAVLSSMTSFFVPFILMSLAYAYILVIARKQASVMNQQHLISYVSDNKGEHRKEYKKIVREQKAMQTLGTIMGVFLVSWLPFFLMYIILPFCDTCHMSVTVGSLITWLGYLNSALNPIIYAFLNSDFRKAFGNIISCGRLRCQEEVISNHTAHRQSSQCDSPVLDQRATNFNRRVSLSLPNLAQSRPSLTGRNSVTRV